MQFVLSFIASHRIEDIYVSSEKDYRGNLISSYRFSWICALSCDEKRKNRKMREERKKRNRKMRMILEFFSSFMKMLSNYYGWFIDSFHEAHNVIVYPFLRMTRKWFQLNYRANYIFHRLLGEEKIFEVIKYEIYPFFPSIQEDISWWKNYNERRR